MPEHGDYNGWCRVRGIPVKAKDCPECLPVLLSAAEARVAAAEALLREYHETWPGPLVHPDGCKVCAFLAAAGDPDA